MPVDRNAFFQMLHKGFSFISSVPFATGILRSQFKRKNKRFFVCFFFSVYDAEKSGMLTRVFSPEK